MFLTVAETATRLRLSVRTLRRLLSGGKIPYVRVSPRRLAISEDALDAYLRGNTWQSEGLTVATSLSSSRTGSEYLSVCRSLLQRETPKRSKRSLDARAGNVVPLVSRKNQP